MDPILVATDMSARPDRAVVRAARIARGAGRPLTLSCAAGEVLDAASDLNRMEEVEAVLEPRCREDEALRGMDTAVPDALRGRTEALDVRMGGPCAAILGATDDAGAELIAVGRHARRGVVRLILGETSTDPMPSERVDVLMAPPAS